MGTRGTDLHLTDKQIVERALRFAGAAGEDIRYRLDYPNGGDDPTRATPAALHNGVHVCDCIGFVCYCMGVDRYDPGADPRPDPNDPTEFHTYGGYSNCDSVIIDASGPREKWVFIDRPRPGCAVMYASVDRGKPNGRVGHTGLVVDVPAEWDPNERDCWARLKVVDCAHRVGRAICLGNGLTWYGVDRRGRPKNAHFVALRR